MRLFSTWQRFHAQSCAVAARGLPAARTRVLYNDSLLQTSNRHRAHDEWSNARHGRQKSSTGPSEQPAPAPWFHPSIHPTKRGQQAVVNSFFAQLDQGGIVSNANPSLLDLTVHLASPPSLRPTTSSEIVSLLIRLLSSQQLIVNPSILGWMPEMSRSGVSIMISQFRTKGFVAGTPGRLPTAVDGEIGFAGPRHAQRNQSSFGFLLGVAVEIKQPQSGCGCSWRFVVNQPQDHSCSPVSINHAPSPHAQQQMLTSLCSTTFPFSFTAQSPASPASGEPYTPSNPSSRHPSNNELPQPNFHIAATSANGGFSSFDAYPPVFETDADDQLAKSAQQHDTFGMNQSSGPIGGDPMGMAIATESWYGE